MNTAVKAVTKNSPASRVFIECGDTLKKINGHTINDVLDYKFYSYDARLFLELSSGVSGKTKLVRIKKREGEELGLEFGSFLMDKERSCANKCVFCFIDQLPRGMRKTLYYKDDDLRLSFLQGNYITLTNLSQAELERIAKLKISPINVSVHTTDPLLRVKMLGNRNAGGIKEALTFLAGAGVSMNCQIVCCPGINDGAALLKTMEDLYVLYPQVASVSIVPVGLTRYRDNLTPLQPFDRDTARKTIELADNFGDRAVKECGTRLFYCGDEFYIKAGLPIPDERYYESYPQLENGVGMLRLLMSEFYAELERTPEQKSKPSPFSVATGTAAADYLTKLLKSAKEKCGIIEGNIYPVKNEFFGGRITVSGLITGGDIARQLTGRELGERLLIPVNMLKSGEELFLDDYTVTRLSEELGVPIRVVQQDGVDLLHAFLGD